MHTAQLDNTMLALSDRTRRAILQRLTRGEARVTELARPFDMSLNAVSKHILVLERAHLVRRRRQGREHYLSVNAGPLNDVAHWIDGCRRLWEQKLNRLDTYLKELQGTLEEPPLSKEKKHDRTK
jgi:DNA-binding transcriptional ArsR family regulator